MVIFYIDMTWSSLQEVWGQNDNSFMGSEKPLSQTYVERVPVTENADLLLPRSEPVPENVTNRTDWFNSKVRAPGEKSLPGGYREP